MMPETLQDKFDCRDFTMLINGQGVEAHDGMFCLGVNRKLRRAKTTRNPRDHAKFYRKDQIRPWIK